MTFGLADGKQSLRVMNTVAEKYGYIFYRVGECFITQHLYDSLREVILKTNKILIKFITSIIKLAIGLGI